MMLGGNIIEGDGRGSPLSRYNWTTYPLFF